jgi:hypothetical protein
MPTDYSITPSDQGQAVEERGLDSLWGTSQNGFWPEPSQNR